MRYLLICGVLSGVALVSWLVAGRRLVTLLDRVTLAQVERRDVDRLVCESSTLELAGKRVDLMDPAYARLAEVSLNSSGHVVLESGGRQFPLGPGQSVPHIAGVPRFEFTTDPGDQVRLTVEQSRLAWPTPFQMNFMTGYAPSRKRSVYLRLRWTKSAGANLEMLWKTEQSYYSRDGWSPPQVETITDGLVRVNIVVAN